MTHEYHKASARATREQIYAILKRDPGTTNRQIRAETKRSHATVSWHASAVRGGWKPGQEIGTYRAWASKG